MKLLLVSDLHMNLRQFHWLEQKAAEADVLVIAGDLLQLSHQSSKDEQISEILPILKRIQNTCTVLVSSGNHDGNTVSPAGEEVAVWIRELQTQSLKGDGHNFDHSGYRFTICPWWNGPETREKMLQLIKAGKPNDGTPWIWIHHAPPRGSKIAWTGSGDAGDPYLLKLIGSYHPNYVFCGHIHNAPFYPKGGWAEEIGGTWVFNAGKQPGEFPTYIEFDLEKKTAQYTNAEERESIDLQSGTVC